MLPDPDGLLPTDANRLTHVLRASLLPPPASTWVFAALRHRHYAPFGCGCGERRDAVCSAPEFAPRPPRTWPSAAACAKVPVTTPSPTPITFLLLSSQSRAVSLSSLWPALTSTFLGWIPRLLRPASPCVDSSRPSFHALLRTQTRSGPAGPTPGSDARSRRHAQLVAGARPR